MSKTKPDLYPCMGERFGGQRDAEEHIFIARHSRLVDQPFTPRLVEQPYAYQCLDGHWHAHLRFA